jgi:hypothetical protein
LGLGGWGNRVRLVRWGAAGGLEALQFVEGAVEGAFGAGFVAGQEGESVGAAGFAEEDEGVLLVAGRVLESPQIGVLLIEEPVEEAGFHAAEAAEAPGGHDHLLDEEGFRGADGLVVVLEGLLDSLEFGFLLGFDDGVLGGEAVAEGIEANGGLTLGGLGAGAELGVPAIGFDLQFGGHNGAGSFRRKLRQGVAPPMVAGGEWVAARGGRECSEAEGFSDLASE